MARDQDEADERGAYLEWIAVKVGRTWWRSRGATVGEGSGWMELLLQLGESCDGREDHMQQAYV